MFIEYALFQFRYALIPFYVVLVVAEALCVYKFKRRKLFPVRLAVSLAVGVGVVFLASMLLVALAPYFMAGTVAYILVFGYTLLALWFIFDEPFRAALFAGTAAYSAQNLAYRVLSILEMSGAIWAASENADYFTVYWLIQAATYLVTYTALYFVFFRAMIKRTSVRTQNRTVLFIAVTMLAITVFLCAWTNAYYFQHRYLLIINYTFSIICCLFILAAQSGMLERSELKRDVEIVNELWERDRRQYELSRDEVDRINVLCHDLKHKIKKIRLDESGLTDEELAQVESVISVYDSKVRTGCEPLDVILTEKSLYCNKNGIRFTCMANGALLDFMNPSDLYSLLGNILNNAIEAVSKIEDAERRGINFTLRKAGGMALIQTENFYEGEIKFKDGLPLTSKSGALHGYGMKSVKMLVDKYGGEMSVKAEGGVFGLAIMFARSDKKS